MGRTVVLEDRLRAEFEQLIGTRQAHVGLLVGQLTSSKDYVSLFVRTPALKDIDKDSESEENVGVAGGETDEIVPDWWVVEHAKQVYALLCGGLSIVGVAVCCSTQQFKGLQLRVRQWLSDMSSYQQNARWLPHTNHIILHLPTNSKKSVCQTIDLADSRAGFRPADLKYQGHSSGWCRLESLLQLDWATSLSSTDSEKELTTRDLLKPLLDLLCGALLTVRGRPVVDGGEQLVKGKKPSSSSQSSPSTHNIKMTWLLQPYRCDASLPELLPRARRIGIQGSLSLVAYVPPKATLDDAINAMKQDAERTVLARAAALREASDSTPASQTLSYDREPLPCRVSVSLPHSQLELSEYLLPSESMEECIGRVCDLTGCQATDVKTSVLEQQKEQQKQQQQTSPDLTSEPPLTSETPTPDAIEIVDGRVVKSYSKLVSIVAAVGVALLAVAVWFVYSMQTADTF